jgi:1-acyl-sn-glycerol-3-phosphate acyltransferase
MQLVPSQLQDHPIVRSPRTRRPLARRCERPVTTWMRLVHWISRAAGRFCWFCTMRAGVIRPEAAEREGGYIIACTHLSHLEPFLATLLVRRAIDWMARIEFFRFAPIAWFMRCCCTFPVRRFGVPVSAIRTAIARAKQGRVVGICPEGGVSVGADSVMRGGKMKQGFALVAARANVPVVPCVMLGTHDLNRIGPWLPFKRAKVWIAFGSPVWPEADSPDPKAARQRMAQRLGQEYVRLYAELRERYGIDERSVP